MFSGRPVCSEYIFNPSCAEHATWKNLYWILNAKFEMTEITGPCRGRSLHER
jgi:hypothetical protein